MAMENSLALRVWGQRALFSRPEMKVERVSYDVITPSAARGILEAIHWKPQMGLAHPTACACSVQLMKSFRRNEVGSRIPAEQSGVPSHACGLNGRTCALLSKISRQQRAATLLKNVDYIIEAEIMLTERGRADPANSVRASRNRPAPRGERPVFPSALSRHARVPVRFRVAGGRAARRAREPGRSPRSRVDGARHGLRRRRQSGPVFPRRDDRWRR